MSCAGGKGGGIRPPIRGWEGSLEGQDAADFLLKAPGKVLVNHRYGTRGMNRWLVHPEDNPDEGHPEAATGKRPRQRRTGLGFRTNGFNPPRSPRESPSSHDRS